MIYLEDYLTLVPPCKIEPWKLLLSYWSIFVLATTFFVARILIRLHFNKKTLLVDDLFAFFALCFLLINAILYSIMIHAQQITMQMTELEAFGILPTNLTSAELPSRNHENFETTTAFFMQCEAASMVIFWSCIWCVKGCFLAFFKRLCVNVKGYNIAWTVITGVTLLSYVIVVSTYPYSCNNWFSACGAERKVTVLMRSLRISTSLDIATDALVIALPISIAIRVKLPLKTKLALCGIFSLGGFIMVMSAVRLIITSDNSDGRPDISWLNLWSFVECATAVIVCNLAIFKFLFRGSSTPNEKGVPRNNACDPESARGRADVMKGEDWTVTRESESQDDFRRSSSSSSMRTFHV